MKNRDEKQLKRKKIQKTRKTDISKKENGNNMRKQKQNERNENKRDGSMLLTATWQRCHNSLILIRTVTNNSTRDDHFIKRGSFGDCVTKRTLTQRSLGH